MVPSESGAYSLVPHVYKAKVGVTSITETSSYKCYPRATPNILLIRVKSGIKMINHGNLSIKSYVLAISFGGDSNRSPHVILWRTSSIYAKNSFYSGLL